MVKQDVSTDPADVRLLGANRIMKQSRLAAHLIEQPEQVSSVPEELKGCRVPCDKILDAASSRRYRDIKGWPAGRSRYRLIPIRQKDNGFSAEWILPNNKFGPLKSAESLSDLLVFAHRSWENHTKPSHETAARRAEQTAAADPARAGRAGCQSSACLGGPVR